MVEFLSSDVGLASIGERPKLSRGGYAAGASFDREGADSGEVHSGVPREVCGQLWRSEDERLDLWGKLGKQDEDPGGDVLGCSGLQTQEAGRKRHSWCSSYIISPQMLGCPTAPPRLTCQCILVGGSLLRVEQQIR